jgi:secondary thiamine-phosphate synthase enzyme
MVKQIEITLPELKRGYHLITHIIEKNLPELPENGLLNVFIKHTSAAITLNENADPSVRYDFETLMNTIVSEDINSITHTLEGADDMPAHLKSSLIGQSVNIPITNYRLNLGIWQGIYLCEFRNYSHRRRIVLTIYY